MKHIFDFLRKKQLLEIQILKQEIEKFNYIQEIETEIETKKLDFEKYISKRTSELNQEIKDKSEKLNVIENSINELNSKYKSSLEILVKLRNEVNLFEDKGQQIEFGLYQPVYNFEHPAEYLEQKNLVIASQLQLVMSDKTEFLRKTTSSLEMSLQRTIYHSDVELMKSRMFSLMQLAFNFGSSNIISKAKWNNINQLSKQIQKLYKQVCDLGQGNIFTVSFNKEYEVLKQNE